MQRLLLLVALLSALFVRPAWAAPTLDDRFQLGVETLPSGDVRLSWTIADGAYLYRDHVKVTAGTPPKVLPATSSPGEMKEDPGSGTVEIWRANGEALVKAADLAAAGAPRELAVTYQGCEEDSICYPPVTRTVAIDAAPPAAAAPPPGDTEVRTVTAADVSSRADAAPAASPTQIAVAGDTGVVSRLAERGGGAWVLLAFAGFGLLLAFTPCVFPMYPILAGLHARDGDRLSPRRAAEAGAARQVGELSARDFLESLAAVQETRT